MDEKDLIEAEVRTKAENEQQFKEWLENTLMLDISEKAKNSIMTDANKVFDGWAKERKQLERDLAKVKRECRVFKWTLGISIATLVVSIIAVVCAVGQWLYPRTPRDVSSIPNQRVFSSVSSPLALSYDLD